MRGGRGLKSLVRTSERLGGEERFVGGRGW